MKGLSRDPTKKALRVRQGGPAPTRWHQRHPGLSKHHDAAICKFHKDVAAASHGVGRAFFWGLTTAAQRQHVEFSFDWMISDGILEPAVMVRIAAEIAREFSRLHAHVQEGRAVQGIADLLERYPAQAMGYAAECVATFDQRIGGGTCSRR